MFHTIIIPHRNRIRELRQTLWSISHSAECADHDYEVIVVHANQLRTMRGVDVGIVDLDHPRVFNKPRLLNLGIEAAKGRIITFLDADMLVGPDWMHTTQRELLHTPSPPTRLCYRVRQFASDWISTDGASAHEMSLRHWEQCEQAGVRRGELQATIARASSFPIAAEAYGEPNWTNKPQVRTPVFGNSQWSIRRDVLGDLRFDEAFVGAGHEDIDFIDTIWRSVEKYEGKIVTEPSASLYHLNHERPSILGSDWCDPKLALANECRYARNSVDRLQKRREKEHDQANAKAGAE